MASAIRIWAFAAILAVILIAAFWLSGGAGALDEWMSAQQRSVQNMMAQSIQSLRAGEAGAGWGLNLLAFGYGFFHAVGPGHGKMLIGGYGLGSSVPLLRLSLLAVLSSLAQALVAVVMVTVGIGLLDVTRQSLTGVAETVMADFSAVLIGCMGAWFIWRGVKHLKNIGHRSSQNPQHHHAHQEADCGCGHAHAPRPEQVEGVRGLRDAALIIASIAIRPCSGAILLLLLTWRLGLFPMGVIATFVMGLGTAMVTVVVAGMAVLARRGSFSLLSSERFNSAGVMALPGLLQMVAGMFIVVLSFLMLT